jgi:hypothetical protein
MSSRDDEVPLFVPLLNPARERDPRRRDKSGTICRWMDCESGPSDQPLNYHEILPSLPVFVAASE